jgi:hypothetical protein
MDQVQSCLRHKRYGTEQAARAAAAALRTRRRYQSIGAYKCREGGEPHWHVGRTRLRRS